MLAAVNPPGCSRKVLPVLVLWTTLCSDCTKLANGATRHWAFVPCKGTRSPTQLFLKQSCPQKALSFPIFKHVGHFKSPASLGQSTPMQDFFTGSNAAIFDVAGLLLGCEYIGEFSVGSRSQYYNVFGKFLSQRLICSCLRVMIASRLPSRDPPSDFGASSTTCQDPKSALSFPLLTWRILETIIH